MRKSIALLIILFTSVSAFAQQDSIGTIDAQRPTLTESYSIITPNTLQFENGLDYSIDSNLYSYGTFLRGTVFKRVELRAFTNFERLNSVGGKFLIMKTEGTKLGIGAAFIYDRNIEDKSNNYRLALTRTFEHVFITYNLGYDTSVYNIALLGIPLHDNINYFIEYSNSLNTNRVHNGFTLILKKDIQLDLSGGWTDYNGWYAGAGFSFRLR